VDGTAGDAAQRRCSPRVAAGWALWGLAVSSVLGRGSAMQAYNGGAMVLADSGPGGPMSSPAYANTFETWNTFSKRTSTSPVTFRLQAETKFGWEVCVTGGCEALGYWDPDKALLLRTDPSRYPIWEGVGQLPGGCDIEYKYLMRPRGRSEGAMWEDCANRIIRTSTIEKAILLVTDPDKMTQEELARQEMVTSQYFNEWTTLAAPFSSTLIFNTARPQEDFKELLEDEAFQRPCALVFCRDSGTEIFVRDYDTPLISGPEEEGGEPLLDTRPETLDTGEQPVSSLPVGSDVNSLD